MINVINLIGEKKSRNYIKTATDTNILHKLTLKLIFWDWGTLKSEKI